MNKKHVKTFRIEAQHSAKVLGSGSLSVLATPMLVAYMESTCQELAAAACSKGEGTVGASIQVDHLAPTAIGDTVTVEAELSEVVKERQFHFLVRAYDSKGEIGRAKHLRVRINEEKFLEKIK